jgi:hypothetical protein
MKLTSRLLFKDSSSYPGGQILSANRSAARGATASLLKYSQPLQPSRSMNRLELSPPLYRAGYVEFRSTRSDRRAPPQTH